MNRFTYWRWLQGKNSAWWGIGLTLSKTCAGFCVGVPILGGCRISYGSLLGPFREYSLAVSFTRYTGEVSMADPCGCCSGRELKLHLWSKKFFIYRRVMTSAKGMELLAQSAAKSGPR